MSNQSDIPVPERYANESSSDTNSEGEASREWEPDPSKVDFHFLKTGMFHIDMFNFYLNIFVSR